ncbi:flavin monoamine oxidase family protein [Flavitalea flava]
MARNPLTFLLQKAFAEAVSQNGRKNDGKMEPIERKVVTDEKDSNKRESETAGINNKGRRRFLRDSACIAGGMLLPSLVKAGLGKNPAATAEKVIIVGAGMAGLHAAYHLKQANILATVFEASNRVGGRMLTLKDKFGEGLTTDVGGEFVDTTHTDILQLLKELDLDSYDLRLDTLVPKTFWFEGRRLGQKDLRDAIHPYTERLLKDIHSLPSAISYKTAETFRVFDEQSITEYLQSIGIGGWLFKFLDLVLTREYGMESSQQSAINFLIMFEAPVPADKDYELFGQDHEVIKIKGGSQRLTDALYERLKDQVQLEKKLVEIGQQEDGRYSLHFEQQGNRSIEIADQVILALPFTILRSIHWNMPMAEWKRKCIDEIGYGNSCKFIMGVKDKPWRQAGTQGYTFTDLSFGCGWDSSQAQSEQVGSFTVFGGGNFADWVQMTKEEILAGQIVPALNQIYPGAGAAYNGKKMKYCWSGNPYSKAGYSVFKKGQWSTLAGWEGAPVGKIYFAGEHVSREFQGYMNGAAQTGRMAAEMVAANLIKSLS